MIQVSVIILNYNYPHNIMRLLPSLKKTSGIDYETVVVDNGSEPGMVAILKTYKEQGLIDTLILEPVNHQFEEGNNIGVREGNQDSEFVLLLNNDTQIWSSSWLRVMVEWANGLPKVLFPLATSTRPAKPKNIRRGIVSIDWSYDPRILGSIRPDGWCCLIRRELWRNIDPDYSLADMRMLASIVREGHSCGVLCEYAHHIKHYNQGSSPPESHRWKRTFKYPHDLPTWWKGLSCESLDFTVGPPHQHQSYLSW